MGKPKFPTAAHAEADRLLGELAAARKDEVRAEALLAAELERLKASSPHWAALEAACRFYEMQREMMDLRVKDLEREHRVDLFGDLKSARIEVPAGALLYELTHPVIRAKGRRAKEVLAEIEEYALLEMYGLGDYDGFLKVLKIVKSLNFDAIEEWPDARLTMVGLDRKTVETFGYELKEEKP